MTQHQFRSSLGAMEKTRMGKELRKETGAARVASVIS
jgi:hypothetical protein